MVQLAYFLQFAIPIAGASYLIWRFVIVRLLKAHYYQESVRAEQAAIRERLRAAEPPGPDGIRVEPLTEDQIDQAIQELNANDPKDS